REPTRPRPQSPPLRLLVRLLWTVTPAACVAGKLPADAARRSPQSPSNLSQSMSFLTPTVDLPAVCLCHTLVSHIVLQVFDHTKNITYRGAFSYNRCCNSRWNAGSNNQRPDPIMTPMISPLTHARVGVLLTLKIL
ncbi:MAG: hypothetical protein QF745_07800, partial [Planctomycetota bacterium]|nr:hypothetical protein [Planctomycetota bacterium]